MYGITRERKRKRGEREREREKERERRGKAKYMREGGNIAGSGVFGANACTLISHHSSRPKI